MPVNAKHHNNLSAVSAELLREAGIRLPSEPDERVADAR